MATDALTSSGPPNPDSADLTSGRVTAADRPRRPYKILLLIAAGGLLLRLVMVLVVHPTCPFDIEQFKTPEGMQTYREAAAEYGDTCFSPEGDALAVYLASVLFYEGKGFQNPFVYLWNGEERPGAGKPPIQAMTIAGQHTLGMDTPTWARVFSALVGAGGVFVLGLAVWFLAGRRAGIVAALATALYPMFWIADWRMMQDSYLVPIVGGIILLAYRLWARPTTWRAIALGLVIFLACMTRVESIQLLVFLVLPLAAVLRDTSIRDRIKFGVVTAGMTLALVLPWQYYVATQFNNANLLNTGSGTVLLNGSCDSTFYGDLIGYLDFNCFDSQTGAQSIARIVGVSGTGLGDSFDETDVDNSYRDKALDYVSENRARLPVVGLARIGRLWDVYRPAQNVTLNATVEDRGLADSWAGLISYYLLLPFAIYGGITLWRRRITVIPLVAPAIVVTLTALFSFGLTRYRLTADVSLVIAAAVGIDAAITAVRTRASGARSGVVEPPLEATVWRSAAWDRRPRHLTARQKKQGLAWAGIAGAGLLFLAVTSAAAERPEPSSSQATRNPDYAQLCTFAKDRGILASDYIIGLEGANVDAAIADFTYARTLAPAALVPQLDDVLALLAEIKAVGGAKTYWGSLSTVEQQEVLSKVITLLDEADKQCPN